MTSTPTDEHRVGPFACLGQRWSVTTDEHAFAELVAELFAPLHAAGTPTTTATSYRVTHPRDGSFGGVHRDEELLRRARRPSRLLEGLIWAINQQVIGASADRLLLHAGAVADRDGRVALLPAPMESGKTTLVAGLLDRGTAYLTDEAAAIDPDLTVRGYAKPLSIDRGSWEVLRHHEPQLPDHLTAYMSDQWQVPPHRFTDVVATGRLAVIAFPTFRAGAPTTLDRLDTVTALDLARASTFGFDRGPLAAERVRQLADVVASVRCYELVSGDLAEACGTVLDALAAAPTDGLAPARRHPSATH